ncbi:hypothetical protein K0M31_019670 [Melipona bicolor]|uniref:Uncharacterized protein n=1 Tax=Melipona bicolor TaxID=60889 RepID=A0AA40G2T2_9HYME|nr:hypothetical protein K0M31_019670 [Melipona bicolor]
MSVKVKVKITSYLSLIDLVVFPFFQQCQSLVEENRRLQDALTASQVPDVVIDSVFLQTQVDTLQWQLKQVETNKQMYRSLMEQVVHFLDRARKSLDILHEKSSHKDKSAAGRVPRSRSVHAVDADSSPNRATSASPTSITSRFPRVKPSAQTSYTSNIREFTWSLFRRTDPAHCTPPRRKPQEYLNRAYDDVTYRRPELNPNEIPPEKLSQEAFRLMRTVQSLLSMREPDLARVSSTETSESSPSPVDHHRVSDIHNHQSLNFQNNLRGSARYGRRSSCENESSSTDNESRTCFLKTSSKTISAGVNQNLQGHLPGVRRSIDATSLNSGSSKTTEEEDLPSNSNCCNGSIITGHARIFSNAPASTSTPNKREKEVEKTEKDKSKPAASVSSVEDESGFSSMSSFQEVGLPNALPISPIKGCHTEVGLPKVPLGRNRHRKWSSTMAETVLKRQRNSLTTSEATAESLSVWV